MVIFHSKYLVLRDRNLANFQKRYNSLKTISIFAMVNCSLGFPGCQCPSSANGDVIVEQTDASIYDSQSEDNGIHASDSATEGGRTDIAFDAVVFDAQLYDSFSHDAVGDAEICDLVRSDSSSIDVVRDTNSFRDTGSEDIGVCQHLSCEDQGAACGQADDGCGLQIDCGVCDQGLRCGTEGYQNICVGSGWFGLGNSDFGDWRCFLNYGSASGGGASQTTYDSTSPSIAVDRNGLPIVAWAEGSFGFQKIFVKRFNGNVWTELSTSATDSGISSTGVDSIAPTIALDSIGNPVVAWASGNSMKEIYVKKYDGVSWTEVGTGSASEGGISSTQGWSSSPSIAIGVRDLPIVTWAEPSASGYHIFVREFDGSTWQEIGTGSASDGGISGISSSSSNPTIVTKSDGNPMIAWLESSGGGSRVYVKSFENESWIEVGAGSASGVGISDTVGSDFPPKIALDSNDRPAIVWAVEEYVNSRFVDKIYIKRFDGSRWNEVGDGSASGDGISGVPHFRISPAVTIDLNGNPIVAWNENLSIYVKRFDGTQWNELGGGSATGYGISGPFADVATVVITHDSAGTPIVAWENTYSTWSDIFVKYFNGSDWREFGACVATGGGISESFGDSNTSSLTIGNSGQIAVAWDDDTAGNRGIYIKRFNGRVWVEVGNGSSNGSGISNPLSDSYDPSVLFDSSGKLVAAWTEHVQSSSKIVVKRYEGNSWVGLGASSLPESGICSSTSSCFAPSLSADSSGRILLAWVNFSSYGANIYVSRFEGENWRELDHSASQTGISGDSSAGNPVIATDVFDLPIVAWTDYLSRSSSIFAKKYDGNNWTEIGGGSASGFGISSFTGQHEDPDISLDLFGLPTLAWWDFATNKVYAKYYNGTDWTELGAGSSSGDGIAGERYALWPPSISSSSYGKPVVAWTDYSSGGAEIFVKKFNGAQWVEINGPSATGGGISNSAMYSERPSVGNRGNLVCVAWEETREKAPDIVVRCTEN